MLDNKKITAIVLAAGSSTRFGAKYNKIFESLNGKSVIYYSLKAFDQNASVDEIILVINPKEEFEIKELLKDMNLTKEILIVYGGNTRKQSVHNALKVSKGDIVIIQDGARPMINDNYINNCFKEMKSFKGTTIGVLSKDTIKVTDDNGIVLNTTKRKNTWIIQTPQCFDKKTLLDAHEKYESDDTITDDCMLLELAHEKVKLIEGDYTNIKITTKEDIDIAKQFLQ